MRSPLDGRFLQSPFGRRLAASSLPARPGPQAQPASLMPFPQSTFGSASGWNANPGVAYDIVAGTATWDGTQTSQVNQQISLSTPVTPNNRIAGLISITEVQSVSPENVQIALGGGGGFTLGVSSSANAKNMIRMLEPTLPHTLGRVVVSSGFEGTLTEVDFWDMEAMLAKPWRLHVVFAQSNWVFGDQSEAFDPLRDLVEKRGFYMPQVNSNINGAVIDGSGIGNFLPVAEPLQHQNVSNSGRGPAQAYMTTVCDNSADDITNIYLATGWSGAAFLAPASPWFYDPAGASNGAAQQQMRNTVAWCLANGPAGTRVETLLACQGESDGAGAWADSFNAMALDLRSVWGRDFPIVVNEIGRNSSHPDWANTLAMIADQSRLDKDSGDPLALPLCKYVSRPANSTFAADNVHYSVQSQKDRGVLAANAFLDMTYAP